MADRLAPGPSAPFRFVLVEPQYPGNVGACARVLKNLGFDRWALVRPACAPTDEEAVRLAVDAIDVLRSVEVVPSLDEALRGAGVVVGTTRRAGKHRRPHYRFDDLAGPIARTACAGETVAVLYGREDHGLSDVELDRCTHLAYLPSSDVYPSFNLAQAVAITAWEIARALEEAEPEASERAGDDERLADDSEREAMYRHLQTALTSVGFLHRDNSEPLMRRFRRLIGRAAPTSTETRMLRGIARQVLWAAGRAGLPTSGPPEPSGDDDG